MFRYLNHLDIATVGKEAVQHKENSGSLRVAVFDKEENAPKFCCVV